MKLNRNIRPNFIIEQELNIPEPKKRVLNNGLEMYSLNTGKQDIIKLVFIFDAGTVMETDFFQAYITNSMLLEGSEKFTSAQIADKLDFTGAFIRPTIDKDYGTIAVYTLKKYLEEILRIVLDIIQNPVFEEKEIIKNIQLKKQKYLLDFSKVKMRAKYHFQEMVFGSNHPYGKVPKLEFFDKINKESLVDFHSKHYKLSKCKVIAAGKIDEKTIDILSSYFNIDEKVYDNEKIIPPFQPIEKTKKIISIKDTQQVAVWVGKQTINRNHEDYPSLYIVNAIFGGYFGSRLTKNIRETKGYTYGIGSVLLALKLTGYFLIITEAKKAMGNIVVEEIYREMGRLCNEKISDEELKLVKNYLVGDMMRSFDNIFSITDGFQAVLENNMGMSYYRNLFEKIKNISPEQILEISQKYLMPDTFFEVQVGAVE